MNRRDFMKGVGILLSFLGGWKGEKKPVDVPTEPIRATLKVLRHRGFERVWFDQNGYRVRESDLTLTLSRPPQNKVERRWVSGFISFPVSQGFVRKVVSISEDTSGTVWSWSIRDEEIPQPQRGV